MTSAEHDEAMRQRLLACGFRPRGGGEWSIPGGGYIDPQNRHVALTRTTACCESYWRTMSVTRASVPALMALYIATADLPERYGHIDYRATPQPVHVPGRGGFGTGAIDDTKGS